MKRVIAYSPEGSSLDEILSLEQQAAKAGILVTECAIGCSWGEVVKSLRAGDSLVVRSLSCFSSLNELLGFVGCNGVRVYSLTEEWFSAPISDPAVYQTRLYELGSSLHAARTQRGLNKALAAGRRPGRRLGSVQLHKSGDYADVLRVDSMREQDGLSVAEACRQAGITVYLYYRMRKKEAEDR